MDGPWIAEAPFTPKKKKCDIRKIGLLNKTCTLFYYLISANRQGAKLVKGKLAFVHDVVDFNDASVQD